MKKIGVICFWGRHFSPSEMENVCDLSFYDKNEVGDIGTTGKYRGKPYDYGSGSLSLKDFPIVENDTFVPISLLSFLEQQNSVFNKLGVDDIDLTITLFCSEQCNLEVEPSVMSSLSKINVSLCISVERE